jgi:hypothetical protein
LDADATHTLLETEVVLAGLQKWANRLPHAVFTKQRIAEAQRVYRISDNYMCDIGMTSDL